MEYFQSDKFQTRVEQLMKKRHIPGAAVAIIQGDAVNSRGFGLARLNPPVPCTPDTLFDIASSSKSMTAGAVAVLVEDPNYPEVTWTTPVSQLLPDDFVLQSDEHTKHVTVEDILSHRTGVPPHDVSYLGPRAEIPDTPKSVTRNLRNLKISHPIRTKYMYNNVMYTVATHIIEQVTKTTFPEYLKTTFFEPLQMNSTNIQPSAAIANGLGERLAKAYVWRADLNELVEIDMPEAPEAQGAGSVVTCVNDYIKWVRAAMYHKETVTEAVSKAMIKQRMIRFQNYEYSLPYTSTMICCSGWNSFHYRGRLLVSHAGEIDGVGTYHFFMPDQKFGGCIFTNGTFGRHLGYTIAFELIDSLLEVTGKELVDWDEEVHKIEGTDADYKPPDFDAIAKSLYPELTIREPNPLPLDAYVGNYTNKGYHTLTVEIKDGDLFIDGSDRSLGFKLAIFHVSGQIMFAGHLHMCDQFGGTPISFEQVQFKVDGASRVVSLGIGLEPELEDELIWFDKI